MSAGKAGDDRTRQRMAPYLGLRVAAAALVFFSVLVAGTLFAARYGARDATNTIGERQAEIAEAAPDLILLGNSMLGEAVDDQMLGAQTGLSIYKWASGGSMSAYWYIATKNVIAAGPHRPSWLLIFFRDTFLTDPEKRVDGIYRQGIEQWTRESEPLLEEIAYKSTTSQWSRRVEKAWPLLRNRTMLNRRIENTLNDLTAVALGVPTERLEAAAADVFAASNMIPEKITGAQLAAEQTTDRPFDELVEESFLPHIIRIAEAADIRLCFVRVKRRRVAEGEPEPEDVVSYVADLRDYLGSRDIPFIDFTHDPRLTIDHFAEGDHLDRDLGRPVFTQLLAEALSDAFGD